MPFSLSSLLLKSDAISFACSSAVAFGTNLEMKAAFRATLRSITVQFHPIVTTEVKVPWSLQLCVVCLRVLSLTKKKLN